MPSPPNFGSEPTDFDVLEAQAESVLRHRLGPEWRTRAMETLAAERPGHMQEYHERQLAVDAERSRMWRAQTRVRPPGQVEASRIGDVVVVQRRLPTLNLADPGPQPSNTDLYGPNADPVAWRSRAPVQEQEVYETGEVMQEWAQLRGQIDEMQMPAIEGDEEADEEAEEESNGWWAAMNGLRSRDWRAVIEETTRSNATLFLVASMVAKIVVVRALLQRRWERAEEERPRRGNFERRERVLGDKRQEDPQRNRSETSNPSSLLCTTTHTLIPSIRRVF